MIVYINDKEVTIFKGARIMDALLAFSKEAFEQVRAGNWIVTDQFGFRTEPDGPLSEGQHLTLKPQNSPTTHE